MAGRSWRSGRQMSMSFLFQEGGEEQQLSPAGILVLHPGRSMMWESEKDPHGEVVGQACCSWQQAFNWVWADRKEHLELWDNLSCSSGNGWMGYFPVVCPVATFIVCCSLYDRNGFAKCFGGACKETYIDLKAWVCPVPMLNHMYIAGALRSQLKPWPVVRGSHIVGRWGGWKVPISVLQVGWWSVERLHRMVEITEEAKGRITIESRSQEDLLCL